MNIDIEFDDSVANSVAKKGFDPVYGARPLRRAIQGDIEDKLSEAILDGTISKQDRILCSYSEENYIFTKRD